MEALLWSFSLKRGKQGGPKRQPEEIIFEIEEKVAKGAELVSAVTKAGRNHSSNTTDWKGHHQSELSIQQCDRHGGNVQCYSSLLRWVVP